MKKIQGLLIAAAATLAFAGTSARADTVWNFTYSGSGVSASGSFDTLGDGSTPSLVQWMTGTYSDGTTVNGAISLVTAPLPGTNTSADGLYFYDNLFGDITNFDVSLRLAWLAPRRPLAAGVA